ncbi:hypothetical protein [Sphingomonas sp.]|uniref:hypothetical protein n=1 Tax=Sphingomonas sp. TaxID=28214 RepID=UPI002DD668BE|nr:hypothetical protein [Sphingomonas sp.]
MVNNAFLPDSARGAERRLILSYARVERRGGLAALLALDDALGDILRSTREPMVGQMRLTWWHDAVVALDTMPAPAQPILRGLAEFVPSGTSGASLAPLADGWGELLDEVPDLEAYAEARGTTLFLAAGALLGAGPGDPVALAGRGWALADLAANTIDATLAERARTLAAPLLGEATGARWSRPARPLGAMAHLAAMPDAPGTRRVARALWHRLAGR